MNCRLALILCLIGLMMTGCRQASLVQESTLPIPVSSATIPAPRTDLSVQQRWAETFTEAKSGGENAPLVFLGDSITHGWTDDGKEIWNSELAKWHPLNLGVGGDRTENVLWRLEHGQLDSIHPKVLVLLIGTNNIRLNTASEIADGIHAIVRLIHAQRPETHIIVMKVFPRDELPGTEWRNKLIEVNRQLTARVRYHNVELLDINGKLLEPDGTISKDKMPDFLHPGPKGYEIWGAALRPLLAEYFN
jgi:lysophospholipase L1-like esterase